MHQVEKMWRTSGEKYMEIISTQWGGGLDKKTSTNKSKHGMEPNM
jgi:hypothetical protein